MFQTHTFSSRLSNVQQADQGQKMDDDDDDDKENYAH